MLSPYCFWCRPNFICNARMRILPTTQTGVSQGGNCYGGWHTSKAGLQANLGPARPGVTGQCTWIREKRFAANVVFIASDTLAVEMSTGETGHRRIGLRAVPPGVWALGFVSLFMDISSEMIHGLLPVFLTSVLGASAETVG